jgi:hypothetical protein
MDSRVPLPLADTALKDTHRWKHFRRWMRVLWLWDLWFWLYSAHNTGYIRRALRNERAYNPLPSRIERPPTSPIVGPFARLRLEMKR